MSDSSISIIPRQSRYPNSTVKAREIVDWLIAKDIIKPTLSYCLLGSSYGYAISDGAKEVTVFPSSLPFHLTVNGLEIITERQVFDTGQNPLDELICPNCTTNIAFSDVDFNAWSDHESDTFACPQCEHESEIHNYTFHPDWGFSDLGFTFWNWPDFTDDFIEEFAMKLGCDISVVRCRV